MISEKQPVIDHSPILVWSHCDLSKPNREQAVIWCTGVTAQGLSALCFAWENALNKWNAKS